jgi:predicted RNase H-like HicB family nuclease
MSNQIDMNKFNKLISQASDAVMCNSECRQQRTADKLKQNYLTSQTNLASASNQVQVAQKNYVTFTQGQSGYNDLLDNQLQEQAQKVADTFTEYFDSDSEAIKTQIDTYEGLLLNFKNVAELYVKYKKENTQLIKDLKNETNDILTNERKTYYEDQKIDGLKGFYYYILLGIYIIFLIGFIIFSLKYPSQTTFSGKLVSIVGFILLPFFSTWILGKIIYLIYTAYELLPKNVYAQKNY